MTADAGAALREMLTDLDAPVSVKFVDDVRPRIRIDLSGGDTVINHYHDAVLATLVATADTLDEAATLIRTARDLLEPGTYAGALVTKVRSTPPRYEDGAAWTPPAGVASTTVSLWLHPA